MLKNKKKKRKKRYQLNIKLDYDKEPELIYLLDHTDNKTGLIRMLVTSYYKDKIVVPF